MQGIDTHACIGCEIAVGNHKANVKLSVSRVVLASVLFFCIVIQAILFSDFTFQMKNI